MKALEIDGHVAEAHNTLAYITGFYEWRWEEAEPYFKRAIELNPNFATAHQWYAEYLFSMRRFDEAIKEARRSQELDPLSAIIHTIAGMAFYHANQYDRAVEQFHKALEIDDDFYWALFYMATSLREQGWTKEAIEGYLKALQALGLGEEEMAKLRHRYNTSDLQGYYRWFIDEGFEKLDSPYILHSQLFVACVFLGEKDLAFEWLERDFREKRRNTVMVRIDPALAELRSDPRYEDLMRRMGLAQ
jgi:tetratricopeptide (TPR) repeat protein